MDLEPRNTSMNEELAILDGIAQEHFQNEGLYPYQKDLYWRIEQNALNIILKSRKIGISFFYGGFSALKAITGKKVGIISQSQPQAYRVGQFMDDWIEGFKRRIPDLPEHIIERNRSHLLFDNRGEVVIMPNSSASVVGYEFDYLFLDEWARFLHGTDQHIWTAIFPSLSRSHKMSVVANSTPYGEGNLFHQQYTNRKEYPDFKPVFYHYSECPDINIDLIRRNLDDLSFKQEYEGMFIGDMTTYFPFSLIRGCINGGNENIAKGEELHYLNLSELMRCPWPMYGFMDVGKRVDFSAIMVVADTGKGLRTVYKRLLRSPEEKAWNNQYAEARTLLDTGKLNRFYIDRTGVGQEISDTLTQEYQQVKGFDFNQENKAEMFPAFRKRLENKGIELVDDMDVISSLHMLERTQAGNSVVYGSDKRNDETGHADLAVALIGAVYAYDKESGGAAEPVAWDAEPIGRLR